MSPTRPIIGISGGIGSGKSFVADMFRRLGCLVISADRQVDEAYRDPAILDQIRRWWGQEVFGPDGAINRKAIGAIIFNDVSQRLRLEGLIHPYIAARREQIMQRAAGDPAVRAFVWDTPLLFETGLNQKCDAVVFVDAPLDVRLDRVHVHRGWDYDELIRREKLQMPLDKKRELSHYIVTNTADARRALDQVQQILTRILAKTSDEKSPMSNTGNR